MLENRSHVNTIFFRFSTSTFFLPLPFRRDRSQKSEASLREGSGSSGPDVKMAFTNSCCAKLRGLPFDATEEAVREFLKPFEPHGLFLSGGRSGEAYADFGTNDQAVAVVKGKNKQYLGPRYVELFPCSRSDMEALAGSGCARLRGLPFEVTESEVVEFLRPYEPHGLFLCGGRSGEAYVDFGSNDQLQACVNDKNRQFLGARYVEFFTVSRSDMEENRSVQGSFVRAQGLPFSCTEADLAAFFGAYGVGPTDCAIKYKQMQYEMKPSGNGYARFPTAEAAEKACLELNRQTIGSRYIELFGTDLS